MGMNNLETNNMGMNCLEINNLVKSFPDMNELSLLVSCTGIKVLEVQILDPQSLAAVAQQPIRGQLKIIARLWVPRICTS
jgi:hypothetical protein